MKHFLAIDIGSSKTIAVLASYDDKLVISGTGISKSRGVKKGIVTNIDEAAKSIKEAVKNAKRIAGIETNKAIVAISTSYTKSAKSYGIVNIPSKEITVKEINRAIQSAMYNANIPDDYITLQAIPYDFKVDDLNEIDDPAGMTGSRLEVSLHLVIAQKNGIDNIKKTLSLAGLEIESMVSAAYASGLATLKDDEKELGVAVIDIGATVSDIAIFTNNSFRYSSSLLVGSHHITNDLSMALHTPIADAEGIKINFEEYVKQGDDLIEISVIGNENEKQKASLSAITQIISARVEETFLLLNKIIEESGLKSRIGAGIVLTGGFTKFYNVKEIASQFFGGLPVRIGYPREIEGLFEELKSPEYSTAIGLLIYGSGEAVRYEIDSNNSFKSKYQLENSGTSLPAAEEREEKSSEKEEIATIVEKNSKNNINPITKFINMIKHWF